jgi:formylglycine-generating enzyme required for sulfatase activity
MWVLLFRNSALIISVVLAILLLYGCGADQDATTAESTARFEVGQMFRDCENCPQMVVVPAGTFRMGSLHAEQDWSVEHGRPREYTDRENPIHEVTIEQPFAAGVHEVTRGQFSTFFQETGHQTNNRCQTFEISDGKYVREERTGRDWRNPGISQTDDHPVVCLAWDDTVAYTKWLSAKTGARYRLLSEAEWEYVARSGTVTYRFWGDDTSNVEACRYANIADETPLPNGESWLRQFACTDGHWAQSPVGSFQANSFGLYDVIGNVWEWVEDCAHETYEGAPTDGSAWTEGGDCSKRILRGGAAHEGGGFTRSAIRGAYTRAGRISSDGFRVARDLD